MEEEVVAVYTMPREFKISYANEPVKAVTHKSFEEIANRYNIPLITVTGKMKDYTESIKNFNPDFILVIGWYFMIPKEIRDIPKLGCAGMHASLLPKYRGGAPINWAIINGESRSGISFFYFEEGVDTGDIIGQKEYQITLRDTCQTVYDKAVRAAGELIKEYIPLIRDGQAPKIKQDQSKATIFPQRKPEDGEIDWNKSAFEIYNWIRAQTQPYPGAFTYRKGEKLLIWETKFYDFYEDEKQLQPGQVMEILNTGNTGRCRGILVATKACDIPLLITRVGTEGKGEMEAVDYAYRVGLGGRRYWEDSIQTSPAVN
jgi:methionyl-tRNA formyltransferase